jgi:hypothetical protein
LLGQGAFSRTPRPSVAVLHSNPASRKLYFIALKKDKPSKILRVVEGCFDALSKNKVNPFTKTRQW